MEPPDIPANEPERLQALRELEILDTAREERFDRLTRLASYITGTPIALVSLIDETRQWFKSKVGLDLEETPRAESFCGHAILGEEMFEIPDATLDPRFADNPAVTGDPAVRFYAGMPLTLESGHCVGTLCVADRIPRTLSHEQRDMLGDLANTVVDELQQSRIIARARQQAEQDARLRVTLSTVAEGIMSISAKGRIEEANPAAEALFGYRRSELIGLPIHRLLPDAGTPEAPSSLLAVLTRDVSQKAAIRRKIKGRHKDGNAFLMRLTLSRVRHEGRLSFIAAAHDISTEARLRQKLQTLAEFQQAILDSAPVSIISTDATGMILSFNRGAEALLGWRADEMTYQATPEAFHDKDEVARRAQQLSRELGRRIDPGMEAFIARARLGKVDRHEWTYLHRNGERIPVELTISALRDPNGSIQGYLGVAIDLRERKEVERAKSQFISTVSHELRTPMTSIRGALSLISARFSDQLPAKARSLVENAERNSERLTLLINDILDAERLDSGGMSFDFQQVDLRALLDQSIAANRHYADNYFVTVNLANAPDAAPATLDGHRIQQVMANLLSNAIKFSEPGGTVEVTLKEHGDQWRVGVSDSGRGIPEAFRHRIFERFSQVDSSDARDKGGTGLGLTICRSIIEHHNGHIDFQSREGEGSEFFFLLPRERSVHQSPPHEECDHRQSSILVCTPSQDVGDALCQLLNRNGFLGSQCSPPDAQSHLRSNQYDALMLDFSGDSEQGLALLAWLRANAGTRELPVVVVSGAAQEKSMKTKLRALNVFHWLQKPVDHLSLKNALKASTGGRLGSPRLLHVEDDRDTIEVVQGVLEGLADPDYATTIEEARKKLQQNFYEVVLLDLNLPDGDGRTLLEHVDPASRVIIFSVSQPDGAPTGRVVADMVKSQVTNAEILQTLSRAIESSASTMEVSQ